MSRPPHGGLGLHRAPVTDPLTTDPLKPLFRWLTRLNLAALVALLAWLLSVSPPAQAHDYALGPLRIDHPYATPTPPGARTGAAYVRTIRNRSAQADRLVGASTPVAQSVEIHHSEIDANQVMRMRAVDGIAVPAGGELRLRHGGSHHLMLIGLKAPLKDGERFPLRLRFQHAGEREVTAWVQQPRRGPSTPEHRH